MRKGPDKRDEEIVNGLKAYLVVAIGLTGSGAWLYFGGLARSACRLDNTPVDADYDVGFRCVVVPHAALPG